MLKTSIPGPVLTERLAGPAQGGQPAIEPAA
jgi:hypothetical protein